MSHVILCISTWHSMCLFVHTNYQCFVWKQQGASMQYACLRPHALSQFHKICLRHEKKRRYTVPVHTVANSTALQAYHFAGTVRFNCFLSFTINQFCHCNIQNQIPVSTTCSPLNKSADSHEYFSNQYSVVFST